MTDGGKWPQAVEKTASGNYKLMQTYSAWTAWQACWPLARAAIYSAEMAQIEAPLRAEIDRLGRENFDLAAGQCVHATTTEYGVPRCAALAQMREALRRVHKWGAIAPNYSYTIASDVEKWFKGGERGELPPLPDWEERGIDDER
jgi:hypothetical protein